tara:strand:- start:119 stop:448 length:330 start_codon:yes stop_codon:yes gene_type:complete
MKKYQFCIIIFIFTILINSCGTFTEGMSGSKRSKSGDEFLVHKKKPLVVPPDFDDMPLPKNFEEEEQKLSSSSTSIEDLLNIKRDDKEILENENNNSLEQSILKKIKQN